MFTALGSVSEWSEWSELVPSVRRGVWSAEEHDRFLSALQQHPDGPWTLIVNHVGTRSSRQVQTHAQKYYEKLQRRVRGLLRARDGASPREHRVDAKILNAVKRTIVACSRASIHIQPGVRRVTGNGVAPPCLRRLSGSPPTSPTSADEGIGFEAQNSATGFEQHELELLLPSVEQSLDFLIACFEGNCFDPPALYMD